MKTKILIIEDNVEVRENTQEILELSGYEVAVASNGKTGVEAAKLFLPHLILCDIMMPELDGYGVLKILSLLPETKHIPFVFMSAKAEKSDFRKGMNLGANEYITKPFDDTELVEAIEIRLKKQAKPLDVEILADSNLLRALRNPDLLTQFYKVNKIDKKQFLFKEGNYPNEFYALISGKIKLFKTNSDGKEFIIELLAKDDFLGYLACIENVHHSESAVALENSEVCIIPKKDLLELLHSSSDAAMRLVKLLTKNIKEKEDKMLSLAYNSVRQRTAEALLLLQNRYRDGNENANFSVSCSREDLASIVATATESLIRTLSDFKAEKLIEIHGSKIVIINTLKLENIPK